MAKEHRVQVTVYMPSTLLKEIDSLIDQNGDTRSAWIIEACKQRLAKEGKTT